MTQVGVSLVVVIGAVLFVRSLDGLLAIDSGFTRKNVLVASIDVISGASASFYGRLLESVTATPGVVSAAVAWSAPLGISTGWTIHVPNYVSTPNEPGATPSVEGILRRRKRHRQARRPGASTLLYGVQPGDVASTAIAVAVLAAAGAFAAWIPARRASRIDPLIALRQD